MKIHELQFEYPEDLVATKPMRPSRILTVQKDRFKEVLWFDFLKQIPYGDLLIVNNTKVMKRRVFSGNLEILFLHPSKENPYEWQVLFPSKKFNVGDVIELPMGKRMVLKQKGRPQIVETDAILDDHFFEQTAEIPLPPYIQKARGERRNLAEDHTWYQTHWAKKPGSFAAPTASLHFSQRDFNELRERGVEIHELTLHVGLGTFLPVTTEDLNDHEMHEEYVEIPFATWQAIERAHFEGRKVWVLGTTCARALESMALNKLTETAEGYSGFTDILILPGHEWKVVDRLMTNFHLPESTLLALVAAFSNIDIVKKAYKFAIDQRFRLFSYGDLSVWYK